MFKAFGFAVAALMAFPGVVSATQVTSTLTSVNGEGDYIAREVLCPDEPGPFFEFGWSGVAAASQSTLGGTWTGFTRVHEGGYVAPGNGRLEINMARGGVARLEFEAGDCLSPSLAIAPDAQGDPVATGTLPVRPTLSSGAARGLTGTGNVTVELELGPGADNLATIGLSGTFDVRAPQLSITAGYARWNSLSDYINKRLTVHLAITNANGTPTPGNAYGVRVTQASTNGATVSGLPAYAGDIPAGATALAKMVLVGAQPNKAYTIAATVASNDGLDDPQAPVPGAASVKSSLLP